MSGKRAAYDDGIQPLPAPPLAWAGFRDASHVAYALDRDLRFRCANGAWDAFAVANGADDTQVSVRLVGRPFLDGLCEPERTYWKTILEELLAGRQDQHAEEIPCDNPHSIRRIVVTASPTRDEQGVIDGVLFVNYDVTTAFEKAEAEARLGGALLMARTAAHLLNNQLAMTVGYADLLASDERLPADARAAAREALHGAESAAATITRLGRILDLPTEDRGAPGRPIIALQQSEE